MKTLLLTLSCLFAALILKAQKPDMAQVIVHYKFAHMRDTTRRDSFYKENMLLFVGRNASAYKSYDLKMQDALNRQQVQAQVAAATAAGGPIKITMRRKGTSTEYYQFASEKKLVTKERLINNYLIEETLPVFAWKVSADTATFAGLHCQKATTHFKGRDYTAWFCPDLPYHTGPYKFNGLPGLIVDMADTRKEVVFQFDGIEDASKAAKPTDPTGNSSLDHATGPTVVKMIGMDDPNEDPNKIALPADGIKTNVKEFANLKEAMRKDPQAFMQSAMAASGMNVRGVQGSGPGVPTLKIQAGPGVTVINNPIELHEKK